MSREERRPAAACVTLAVTCLLAGLVLPSSAAAQLIRGRVFDAATRKPLETAMVTVAHEGSGRLVSNVTDERGVFALEPDFREGRVQVAVSALGYAPAPPAEVSLETAGIYLEVGLDPEPLALPELQVVVRPRPPRLDRFGVFDRYERGVGRVFLPDDLEDLVATEPSQLVLRMPGLRVASRKEPVFIRHTSVRGACLPVLFVDGLAVRTPSRPGAFNDVVPPPQMIAAIEAYPNSGGVPPRFQTHESRCGTIMVWTKADEG